MRSTPKAKRLWLALPWALALALVTAVLAPMRPPSIDAHAGAPTFPIRAAFYYPWFPETWGPATNRYTWYTPTPLGYYNSGDTAVIDDHIARMEYAGINVGIASWWGQASKTDQRISLLLAEAHSRNFYWTLYYEPAITGGASQITADLNYIATNYASDPNYLHVNGKPVIFIYTRGVSSCADVTAWVTANVGFYLDPQVFSNYRTCPNQPDSWHQYAPTSAEDKQTGYSFAISPGFWLRTDAAPRLVRDPIRWRVNVQDMVASGAPWQLITTFNEWGEGTAVEGATQWSTCSGYGAYLDELHGVLGGSPAVCGSPCVTAGATPTSGQVVVGASWTVTATSTGCPSPQYEFWMLAPGASSWRLMQAYSASPSLAWNTAGMSPGTYRFSVWVRDSSSSGRYANSLGSYDAFNAGLAYSLVPSCSSLAVSPSPAPPAMVGTQVALDAAAAGCRNPNPAYEFWVLYPGAASWRLAQAYSSASSLAWNTAGLAPGTYRFSVWARDSSSSAAYDAWNANQYFTLTSGCSTLAASAASGSPVTITGAASGCLHPSPLYEFWILNPGSATWRLAQAYSTSATYSWATAGLPRGTYRFSVWVKDSSSSAAYDAWNASTYYRLT